MDGFRSSANPRLWVLDLDIMDHWIFELQEFDTFYNDDSGTLFVAGPPLLFLSLLQPVHLSLQKCLIKSVLVSTVALHATLAGLTGLLYMPIASKCACYEY